MGNNSNNKLKLHYSRNNTDKTRKSKKKKIPGILVLT